MRPRDSMASWPVVWRTGPRRTLERPIHHPALDAAAWPEAVPVAHQEELPIGQHERAPDCGRDHGHFLAGGEDRRKGAEGGVRERIHRPIPVSRVLAMMSRAAGPRAPSAASLAHPRGGPCTMVRWTTDCASRTSPTARRPTASTPQRPSPSDSAGRRSGRPTTSSSRRVDAGDYGRIYDALLTLAWVGRATSPGAARDERDRRTRSATAVVLAKQLATLDSLSGGRVIAGVGVGWNETEFANLGAADRFHVRGAYLDETIRLWRHLWSGSTEPFAGRFHTIARLRLRAAARAGRAPDRGRWPRRAGPASGGHAGRRLPLERDRPRALRRADPGDLGRGGRGWPADAVAGRARARLVRRPATQAAMRCAARRTRSRRRCGPLLPWA